ANAIVDPVSINIGEQEKAIGQLLLETSLVEIRAGGVADEQLARAAERSHDRMLKQRRRGGHYGGESLGQVDGCDNRAQGWPGQAHDKRNELNMIIAVFTLHAWL